MQVWCYLLLVLGVAEGCTLEDHRETKQNLIATGQILEPPQSLPFVPFALVTVIFLHIIVAVDCYAKRNKVTKASMQNVDEDGAVSPQ
ncbi:hypothetical protein AOLI_G00038920 [Acnodon oligacanthus]